MNLLLKYILHISNWIYLWTNTDSAYGEFVINVSEKIQWRYFPKIYVIQLFLCRNQRSRHRFLMNGRNFGRTLAPNTTCLSQWRLCLHASSDLGPRRVQLRCPAQISTPHLPTSWRTFWQIINADTIGKEFLTTYNDY